MNSVASRVYHIPQSVWRVKEESKSDDVLTQHFADLFSVFQIKLVIYGRVAALAEKEKRELHSILDELIYIKSLL